MLEHNGRSQQSLLEVGAQKLVQKYLSHIQQGSLRLQLPSSEVLAFGSPHSPDPITMLVHDFRFFPRLIWGGSLALGESYMDGLWDIENDRLVDFFRIVFADKIETKARPSLLVRARDLFHAYSTNPKSLRAARSNIHSHYDLSNEFYSLMLDSSMTYSCGYRHTPDDTLAKMQEQKYRRTCRKLGLERGGSLIDIGCGWGGMLRYVGRNYPGVHGIGITLSKEQQAFAMEKLKEEGLSSRFRVELRDYREVTGSYDYVVSIGMFEHVGLASYPAFFEALERLLNKGGRALLHTIGLEEDPSLRQDAWVARYIFPGSRLPRLEELARMARVHGLAIGQVENWRPHYAVTLRMWRENFTAHWDRIMKLDPKFDLRFRRMWNYYLQLCEACFIDSTVELYQVLMCGRSGWSLPERLDFT